MSITNRSLKITLLGLFGLTTILVVAALFLPYPYSWLFGKQADLTPGSTTMDPRYMSEITGIETPKDMQRQYENHPEEYKTAIDDELVVMYAYPDPNIRWIGMVFIHHIPSVSETVLGFDGNVIYEQVTSPEVQARIDGLLDDNAFVEGLQNKMVEIWKLDDPGVEVWGFVDSLMTTGIDVEMLGGRPQTIFEAFMFAVSVNSQEISVYKFDNEAARRKVSENISPDGYEYTEKEGEKSVVIHIEYLDQPNFWAKEKLLVQYLGQDITIIDSLSAVLGDPITIRGVGEIDNCNISPYPGVLFPIQEPVEGPREVMEAELVGDFIFDDGCLRVDSSYSEISFVPIWPPEFTLEREGEDLVVVDGNGNKVAQLGEGVFMGGGEGSQRAIPDCIHQQLSNSCDGPFWIVGEGVRPNWRHDSNIFNLETISSDDRSVFLITPQLNLDKWINEIPMITGKLVVDDSMRCPRVQSESGDLDYLPVWPPDYSLRLTEGVVEIINESDDVIVREGENVILYGGLIPVTFDPEHYPQLYDGLPEDCMGPYWIFIEAMK